MQLRTDLAIEAAAQLGVSVPHGVQQETKQIDDIKLTRIVIENEQGEQALGRPRGTYITAELPPLSDDEKNMEDKSVQLGDELRSLLPEQGVILVVGLGNQSVTPDALGPRSAGLVLATRHIEGEFARSTGLDNLRPTAVFVPGVLGQTGVESSEMVKGICEIVKPAAVIVIDALAARSVDRLGCTVQICDTGIAPGSGVGNNRMALNRDTLGVTVIGLGVPTVVDARTVAIELTGREDAGEDVTPRGSEMMVTPREIDLIIRRASQLIAMTINSALQPDYSPLSLISAAG
jgi:spore protease